MSGRLAGSRVGRTGVSDTRPGGINLSRWLAIALVLPGLYGLALVIAVVVDQFGAAG